MAGDYYNLQEVMKKLGKSEDDIKNMIKEGKLHEYRDGANVVFKIDEVDGIAAQNAKLDITGSEIELVLDETGEISLDTNTPDEPSSDERSGGFGLSSAGDITNADTNVGTTGIQVLGETDDEYKLADDTKAETKMFADDLDDLGDLGDLDADSNLESVGSGSGLLDLSLQADDTSLGAVLDDILPAAGDGDPEGMALEDDMAEEADKMFGEDDEGAELPAAPEPEPMRAAPVAAAAPRAAAGPAPQASGAFGIALFLPLLAVIYAAIVVVAGLKGVKPGILKMVEETEFGGLGLIWYIVIGFSLVSVIIVAAAGMGGGGPKAPKKAKTKPAKKKKRKK